MSSSTRESLLLWIVAFALLACAGSARADTTLPDWNAAARQDIRFAIDTIRDNHAGWASGQLDVTVPLQVGAPAALVQADQVKTELDYRRLLVSFVDSFGDPHLGIGLHLTVQGWTGIVLDRIDGQYRVVWSEPGWPQSLPPQGAIVQSCDGVWIGTYLKGRVAPLVNHSLEYPTTFSELARQVMFDKGLGWTPQQCTFVLPEGGRKDFSLTQRTVPAEVSEARIAEVRKHVTASAKPVGLYPLGSGKIWVGMPDFNGRISGAAYEKLYQQLAAIKQPDWVVLDLRGNSGGDSSWGNRALQVFYGKEYGELLGENAAYAKDLIANPAAIALYQRYATLPEFASTRDDNVRVLHVLETAYRAGRKLAREEGISREEALAQLAKAGKRPGGPRIVAVIDRGCFSSCMNLVLQITSMSDTVILGESTLGYSPYGETTRFELPSGHGVIVVPTAVYTGFHATREPFVPDIAYRGNMADDETLMAWVSATLDALKPNEGAR